MADLWIARQLVACIDLNPERTVFQAETPSAAARASGHRRDRRFNGVDPVFVAAAEKSPKPRQTKAEQAALGLTHFLAIDDENRFVVGLRLHGGHLPVVTGKPRGIIGQRATGYEIVIDLRNRHLLLILRISRNGEKRCHGSEKCGFEQFRHHFPHLARGYLSTAPSLHSFGRICHCCISATALT